MPESLTPRQALFVAQYLIDLNATRAAIAAGYSARTAEVAGSRLLRNVKVASEIEAKQSKRLAKLEITAEKVLRELALMGFANMMDYMAIDDEGRIGEFDYGKLTRDQAAAIQEITMDTTGGSGDGERRLVLRTKFKLGDKRGSLELLGKHLELFTEKLKLSGDADLIERLTAGRKRALEARR